jgi:hypothetical protein
MATAAALVGKARRASRAMKTPEQKARHLERKLLPEVQAGRSEFAIVDVANHSEADQRHMVRSEERQTLRRKTKIEKLVASGTLSREEGEVCQWYANLYELGYATLGVTANYGGGVGGGDAGYCLAARYRAQEMARTNYHFARAAIPSGLISMFEGVILHSRHMGETDSFRDLGRSQRASRLKQSFRLAVQKLVDRVGNLVAGE